MGENYSADKRVVGSGITRRNRRESLVDPEYLDKFKSGEEVPAWIPPWPKLSWGEVREDGERIASDIYASLGLGNPFSFVDLGGTQPERASAYMLSQGLEFLKQEMDRGYQLVAVAHCPSEDHTDLWYASQIAINLTMHDVLTLQVRANAIGSENAATTGAELGAEVARLLSEYKLKTNHEADALRGKKTVESASKGGTNRSQQLSDVRRAALNELRERIKAGGVMRDHARHVITKYSLTVRPDALLKQLKRRN